VLTNRLASIPDLLHDLVDIDMECRESRRRQSIDEGDPADAGILRGPLMRDAAQDIPEHRRRQAHLHGERVGRLGDRGERVSGQLDQDGLLRSL
jgi:hypothetical protein